MGNPDRGASAADLEEFGNAELAGSPSIAKLIAVMPSEYLRELYRNERRRALREIDPAFTGTWREYLSR